MSKTLVDLTDEFAREAPIPSGGDRRWRDAACPEFGLRLRANGKRSWLHLTREGRKVRAKVVGDALTTPAEEARRIVTGETPASDMPSVAAFAEVFLADWRPRWAPRTEARARFAVERFIRPAFGARLVDEIRRSDVVKWLASLGENSASADLACSTLSRLMTHAEALGLRPHGSNPASGLRKRKTFRTRYLSAEEFARLWRALDAFEETCPAEVAILRLLVYTGARRDEICGLKWSEIDGVRIHRRQAKFGPRTIWLSRQARAILDRWEAPATSDYVFPRETKKGRIAGELDRAWRKIREAAGLDGLRIHDLRHSFASVAAANNENLKVIGALLGHRDVDSTLGYAHLGEASIAAAAGRNVTRISQLLGDGARRARPPHSRRAARAPRPADPAVAGGAHV